MNKEIQGYKDAVYFDMVGRHITKFTNYNKADSKYCDSKIIIKNQSLKRYIDSLKKNAKNVSYTDFISDCAVVIYEAIKAFDGDWQGIADGSNRKAYGQLVKYIKTNLRFHSLRAYQNDGYDTTVTLTDEEGTKRSVHMFVNCKMESTDALLTSSDSESTTPIIEALGAECGFWNAKKDYELNSFYAYFKANKERILTPSQIQLLDTLEEYGYCLEDKKSRELTENTTINIKTLSDKLKRIKKRVTDAYNREKKFFTQTFAEKSIQKQLGLLNTLMDIINKDTELETQNERFSKAIIGNADSSIMESIFDELTESEYKEIVFAIKNKTIIVSEVLYKLAVIISEHIEILEIELIQETESKLKLAEEEGVIIPDEFKVPANVNTIYLTLNTSGVLINPRWKE